MKNQWIEFLLGEVTVKVSGRGIERFINLLTRNELHIWNLKRHGTETITFKIRLQDAFKIRQYAKKMECSISFLQRSGVPFLVKRLLKNSGFLFGAIGFFFIILLLSNVVWGIEIKGAKPATEYKIRKELDKMGVKVGRLEFFLDDVETIQRRLTDNISAITWVGVELKGTTYHFQVVEKTQPKVPEKLSPRNLISTKKAIIYQMEIDQGQMVVQKNDYVVPGQLLVSGLIGKEGEEVPVAAKGKVWGETWYKSHVELPLKTNFNVFSGKEERKYSLVIGKVNIPLWGFGQPKFKENETEVNDQKIHFLKWVLPISFENKTIREREKITREYNKEDAVKIAVDMAKKDIKSRLNEDARIIETKVLHEVIKNGKVILDLHFTVIENIAKEQLIIQGDS